MASKYHTPPPNVDDGSDLIYKALASFGDNIGAALKERRERRRAEDRQNKQDAQEEARMASQGLFQRGRVPQEVMAKDDSLRAALANVTLGGVSQQFKPEQFVEPGRTHPHQMQDLGGYSYAPFMRESHQDDDRREMGDFREAQDKLAAERARDPRFVYQGPPTTSAIRSALSVQEGKRAKEKDERTERTEERSVQAGERAAASAERAERNAARYARNDEIRLRREQDDEDRKKRLGYLSFSANLIKDPARRQATVATWMNKDDSRLGISPSHVEDELAKLHGARAAGQTAQADPAKRAKQVWDQAVSAGTMNKQAKKRGMPINPTEAVQTYHSVVRPTLSEDEREAMDAEIARIAKETLDAQKRTAPKKK